MALERRQPLIKQGWIRAILLFAAYVLLASAATFALGYFALSSASPQAAAKNVYWWMAGVSVMSVLLVAGFRLLVDRRPVDWLGLRPQHWLPGAPLGLLLGVALIGSGALLMHLCGFLQWTEATATPDVYMSIAVLLLVALGEEMIFRGYILRNLLKSLHPSLALAISSLLFALVHVFNPAVPALGIANVALGGVLLGLTYMRDENLWMPVFLHFSWNVMQGPLLGFPVSGVDLHPILTVSRAGPALWTGGDFGFEGSLFCTLVLAAAILWLIRKRR